MKRLPAILLTLVFALSFAAPVSAQSTHLTGDLTGDWDLTITSPQGPNTSKASLKQEGEKLTGAFKGQRGELPLQGTVKGKEVKLTFTVKFQDQDMPITLSGLIEGETMKGDADFGGLAQGDWSGKRAAAAIAGAAATAATPATAATAQSTDKVDVTGAWVFDVETSAGSGNPSFTFKQEGEKLTGRYKGAFGEADLTGTVKGNQVEFSFKASGQIEGIVTYIGTTDGKTIKGKVSLGGEGEGTFTGKKQ